MGTRNQTENSQYQTEPNLKFEIKQNQTESTLKIWNNRMDPKTLLPKIT